jgi:hypothetical protein
MNNLEIERRVLAIDPTRNGFGFAVFEGPLRLIDWGTHKAKGVANPDCIRSVARLIGIFRPDVLIIEDEKAKGSRRRARNQRLIHQLSLLAKHDAIQVRKISRLRMRRIFARLGASNKHQIARIVSERLPELLSRLPPERKPWMPEDPRMGIFDAAAFALAYFLERR